MDFAVARLNMVKKQIQPWGVLDEQLLKLFMSCPRENFVPENYQALAYADTQIPLGHGQLMLEPKIIARSIAALKLTGKEHVLEIGTGSGYLTYLLAKLSRSVTSVELNKSLATQANHRLATLGILNTEIICGSALNVLQGAKAFDAVILTGSVTDLPRGLAYKTKYGGVLFAIICSRPVMHACIFTRINEDEWSKTNLFETVAPPLEEIKNAATFEF
jgi:protein-L-isoaspartate(D-aspartate) O-methyltransferase